MTLTIIWAVLWFVFASIGATSIYTLVVGFSAFFENEGVLILGLFFGWLAASVWAVFALIQFIIMVVTLVQQVSAGAAW